MGTCALLLSAGVVSAQEQHRTFRVDAKWPSWGLLLALAVALAWLLLSAWGLFRSGCREKRGNYLPLLLLAFIAGAASAQEKPEAPKPKTDRKVFIAGIALLAASSAADAITTRQVQDRGGWENNPLLGRHPGNARLAGEFATELALQVLAFHFTERSHRSWVRWLGRAYIGVTIEEHTRLAACNAGIDVHVPNQNCGALGL